MDRTPISPPGDLCVGAGCLRAPGGPAPEPSWTPLRNGCGCARCRQDEAVYRAGDPGDAMFVVASGCIAPGCSSPDGDAVDMAVVRGRGSCSGTWSCSTAASARPTRSPSRRAGSWSSAGPGRDTAVRVVPAPRPRPGPGYGPDVRTQVDALHEQAFYPVRRGSPASCSPPRRRRPPPPRRSAGAPRTTARGRRQTVSGHCTPRDQRPCHRRPSGRVVTILDRRSRLIADSRRGGARSGHAPAGRRVPTRPAGGRRRDGRADTLRAHRGARPSHPGARLRPRRTRTVTTPARHRCEQLRARGPARRRPGPRASPPRRAQRRTRRQPRHGGDVPAVHDQLERPRRQVVRDAHPAAIVGTTSSSPVRPRVPPPRREAPGMRRRVGPERGARGDPARSRPPRRSHSRRSCPGATARRSRPRMCDVIPAGPLRQVGGDGDQRPGRVPDQRAQVPDAEPRPVPGTGGDPPDEIGHGRRGVEEDRP